MKQISPEVNYDFPADTLLKKTIESTTSDIIILGEDFRDDNESKHLSIYNPDFIGPRDATDYSRGLLVSQAYNLAEVAVINFGSYETERARLISLARESYNDGTLRLSSEFGNIPADQKIEQFVVGAINKALKPKQDVTSALANEKVAQNLGSIGPERELQLQVLQQKETIRKQADRILKVRSDLVDAGASEEFMRQFDYQTKLMTKPQQEAYELEMQLYPHHEAAPLVDTGAIKLFENFLKVTIPSFGRTALRSMKIIGPKSGAVNIIKHDQSQLGR